MDVISLCASGTNLVCGTMGGGAFQSTNGGTSWTPFNSGLANSDVASFCFSGTSLFCGTLGSGVFLSANDGTPWIPVSTDLAATIVKCLAVDGTNLYAGTTAGVWRRPLTEMITSFGPKSSEVPLEFSLHQNYPNPFNPSTTIKYELPQRAHVVLTVFNMLGQKVTTLLDEVIDAGYHEAQFDASDLASGVYLYRLTTGDFVQTRKMILVR